MSRAAPMRLVTLVPITSVTHRATLGRAAMGRGDGGTTVRSGLPPPEEGLINVTKEKLETRGGRVGWVLVVWVLAGTWAGLGG